MATQSQIIEQRNRCVRGLCAAVASYLEVMGLYDKTPTKKNLQKLKSAYSKLSSAQWEVEQWPAADQE